MNRKKLSLILFLLFLLVLPVAIQIGRNDNSEPSINTNTAELKPVVKNAGSLKIMVDPRIELLSAVQLISFYQGLTNFNFRYRDDMKEYFKNYKNHDAVCS